MTKRKPKPLDDDLVQIRTQLYAALDDLRIAGQGCAARHVEEAIEDIDESLEFDSVAGATVRARKR